MKARKTKLVEIDITLNTGFNMFLNPNVVTLRFDKKVLDSTPSREVQLGLETTHKTSMAKSAKNKNKK
jgi:hypothetical protein